MFNLCTRTLLAVFIAAFLFSCSKTNVEGPAGPQGPNGADGSAGISGTLFGKVSLYDSLGQPISDNSGATVLIENSSPQISIPTNADGSFTTPVLSSGYYNLRISKPGFGTMEMLQFQHTGGQNQSQAGIIAMGRKPSSWLDIKNLQVDTVTASGFHYMYVTITLEHPQTLPSSEAVIYFSHAPGAGNSNNDYTYRTVFYQITDSTLAFSPFDQDLTMFSDKFSTTNDVYITVGIDNPKLFTYRDSAGNTVYPATGNLSPEVKVYNNLKR